MGSGKLVRMVDGRSSSVKSGKRMRLSFWQVGQRVDETDLSGHGSERRWSLASSWPPPLRSSSYSKSAVGSGLEQTAGWWDAP